jgi:hypothetical protein
MRGRPDMPKLIVIRRRPSFDRLRAYRILVDGRVVTSIAPGSRVEIPLPPGRHRIMARFGFLRSRPLAIEAGPEEARCLLVGSRLDPRGPWKFAFSSMSWGAPLAILMLNFAGQALCSDPAAKVWFGRFMIPMCFLPLSLMLAVGWSGVTASFVSKKSRPPIRSTDGWRSRSLIRFASRSRSGT